MKASEFGGRYLVQRHNQVSTAKIFISLLVHIDRPKFY